MAKRNKIGSLVPQYDQLFKPVIMALIELGGSGTNQEINEKVYEIQRLTEESLQVIHGNHDNRTEIDYRLAWARTYLKKYGLLDNSKRGVWSLLDMDIDLTKLDKNEIKKHFLTQRNTVNNQNVVDSEEENNDIVDEITAIEADWKDKLLNTLYAISPAAFERLTQRLLRESGFTQVEVTGKVGDGGIDGKGIFRFNGFLSFHIIFQCKRYKGAVTPSQVRDFRGAMQGRADKGLIITTGHFTREAAKEATRDGAPPIDLIDGEMLCEKLKEMQLGVLTKQIEVVEIDKSWFNHL